MANDKVTSAQESDAPLSAAVHQRAITKEAAEARDWNDASLAGRTVTVNCSRDEAYAFWRDFRNLARFMENVEAVSIDGAGRSTWTVKAPGDRQVSWVSELTEDEPGRALAWRSVEGDIRNEGRVEFRDAPPGRGSEITATILYEPPGGDLGKLVAKLFQREPKLQVRRDLRRLKQLLETGEISTSEAPDAAPRGQS